MFLQRERDVWDQLRQQKDLLANANELLSARSAEVEDLRLRCADAKVEAAAVQAQLAPLAARVKELEEELTHAVSDGMPSGPGPKKRWPWARPSTGSWGQRRVHTG